MTRSASSRRIRLVSAVFVLLACIYTAIVSSVVALRRLVLLTQTFSGQKSAEA